MSDEKFEKFAVLIDADNAQPSILDGLLSEIAKYVTDSGPAIKIIRKECSKISLLIEIKILCYGWQLQTQPWK